MTGYDPLYSRLEGRSGQCNCFCKRNMFRQERGLSRDLSKHPRNHDKKGNSPVKVPNPRGFCECLLQFLPVRSKYYGEAKEVWEMGFHPRKNNAWAMTGLGIACHLSLCLVALLSRIWPQVWPEFSWKEVKSYLKERIKELQANVASGLDPGCCVHSISLHPPGPA